MKEITIKYSRRLEKEWRRKKLQKKWFRKYPKLFDEQDLRIALSQPTFHFGEWYVAIHFYNQKRFFALSQKYLFSRQHKNKVKILETLLKPKDITWMQRCYIKGFRGIRTMPPDLLLYKPRTKRFFFAEVKREHDRLHQKQIKYFKEIEKRLSVPVYIVKLIKIK